ARISDLEIQVQRQGLGPMVAGGDQNLAKHAAEFLRKQNATQEDIETYLGYKGAFGAYLRKGDKALDPDQTKAMSVGSDPQGGYWVEPDMGGRIATLVFESSPIRQIANVQSISTDALEGPLDLDEMGAGWVEETGTRSETTTPEIGKYRIPVHEMYAEPRVTQKILDDANINAEGWIEGKIGGKMGRLEATAFVSGDGIIKPRGFLTYTAGTPSAATWAVIQQTNSGANGAFASSNPGDALITLVYNLKPAYRDVARFVLARATLAAARKLKDGQGNYLWQPNFTEMGGGALLGFPITEAEDMPALATNSLSLAFGNFAMAYQVVDRIGIRILRDPYTAKPWVKFYTTRRVGGDVVN
ncbi:MAG: phage major capsid protein, partial [Gammaproteobacteria bacterium]